MYKIAARKILDFEKENFPGIIFETAIVLGSGLGGFPSRFETKSIPYSELDGMAVSTAPGHEGRLYFMVLDGKGILCFSGRTHYYEGKGIDKVVYPVRVMKFAGIKKLIITNASGGINAKYHVGDFMLITDHINMIPNPLIGENNAELGVRFPDMSVAYDVEMRNIVKAEAEKVSAVMHEGVYIGLTGPSYETPAEIRAFRVMGADAVGMSTVPEVIEARHCGIRVCGISLISNAAAGLSKDLLSEEDVIEAGRKASGIFCGFMEEVLKKV